MMINLHFQWHLHELHCNDDDDDESTWIPVKEFQFPSRGFFVNGNATTQCDQNFLMLQTFLLIFIKT